VLLFDCLALHGSQSSNTWPKTRDKQKFEGSSTLRAKPKTIHIKRLIYLKLINFNPIRSTLRSYDHGQIIPLEVKIMTSKSVGS